MDACMDGWMDVGAYVCVYVYMRVCAYVNDSNYSVYIHMYTKRYTHRCVIAMCK